MFTRQIEKCTTLGTGQKVGHFVQLVALSLKLSIEMEEFK
jgi:hypothetical protein